MSFPLGGDIMMNADNEMKWTRFTESGRVQDYLDYIGVKAASAPKEKGESKSGNADGRGIDHL